MKNDLRSKCCNKLIKAVFDKDLGIDGTYYFKCWACEGGCGRPCDVEITSDLTEVSTKELVAELKKRDLDIHPSKFPFIQKPHESNT